MTHSTTVHDGMAGGQSGNGDFCLDDDQLHTPLITCIGDIFYLFTPNEKLEVIVCVYQHVFLFTENDGEA